MKNMTIEQLEEYVENCEDKLQQIPTSKLSDKQLSFTFHKDEFPVFECAISGRDYFKRKYLMDVNVFITDDYFFIREKR